MASSPSSSLTVGIYGVGAIGGHVGGSLALAAYQHKLPLRVLFYCRPTIYKAITTQKSVILSSLREPNSPNHEVPLNSTFTATQSLRDLRTCRIILVAVKASDVEQAGRDLQSVIGRDTIVISLQNGIQSSSTLKSLLPDNVVLGGLVEYNVVWPSRETAIFNNRSPGRILIAKPTEAAVLRDVQLLVNAWDKAHVWAVLSSEMLADQAAKVLVNLLNSINSLSGLPVRATLENRYCRHVWASAIEEAIGVFSMHDITPSKAHGITPWSTLIQQNRLPDAEYMEVRGNKSKIHPSSESSMAQDLMQGRTTEILHLNGYIAKLAREKGATAPINEGLTKLVQQAEQEKKRPKIEGQRLAELVHAPPLQTASSSKPASSKL